MKKRTNRGTSEIGACRNGELRVIAAACLKATWCSETRSIPRTVNMAEPNGAVQNSLWDLAQLPFATPPWFSLTSFHKSIRGEIGSGELMLPQRDWTDSNINPFSGLFWLPKVPRAAGTSVVPLRACQEMKSEGTFFGDRTRPCRSAELPARPNLQGSPDERLEWQYPTEQGQCPEAEKYPRVSAQAEASCIMDPQDQQLEERKPVRGSGRAAGPGLGSKRAFRACVLGHQHM